MGMQQNLHLVALAEMVSMHSGQVVGGKKYAASLETAHQGSGISSCRLLSRLPHQLLQQLTQLFRKQLALATNKSTGTDLIAAASHQRYAPASCRYLAGRHHSIQSSM